MKRIESARACFARNIAKVMTGVAFVGSSMAAHAEGDAVATAVTTQLGTLATTAGTLLAAAILIPVGFKVYAIAKRALNKA